MNSTSLELISPLIYDDTIDTTNIRNILLISSDASDLGKYCNPDTFSIIYSQYSNGIELLALLEKKFKSLKRISFAFHYMPNNYFLDDKPYFDASNKSLIVNIVKTYSISHIDFLACNTLKDINWTNYYSLLQTDTNIVIGASSNYTGNPSKGGDWIMESTNENIQSIYFTSDVDYLSLLDTYTDGQGINYSYTIGSGLATIINAPGLSGAITFPSSIIVNSNTYVVNKVEQSAFQGNNGLTSITSTSITYIRTYAFAQCGNLTTVNLPNVDHIETLGFFSCSKITSITIPNVTFIDSRAFDSCSLLTSISIPKITYLYQAAFAYCIGLTSIDLPGTLNIIGTNVFQFCSSLTTVTIGYGLTKISSSMFRSCTNLSSIIIPSSITSIENDAFINCLSLLDFNITSNVTTLLQNPFSKNTVLTIDPANLYFTIQNNIVFNKNLTILYFCNDKNLLTYTVPDSVISIGNYAFSVCTLLTSITTANVTTIGQPTSGWGYSFAGCTSLHTIVMPLVTVIYSWTFSGCTSLLNISMPNLIKLGHYSFYNCTSLQTIVFPNSLINLIQTNANDGIININSYYTNYVFFYRCTSLTNITFSNQMTFIPDAFFIGCTALTSITLPSSITRIGAVMNGGGGSPQGAFNGCTSLTSISMPGVTYIGQYEFQDCTSLTTITFPKGLTEMNQYVCFGCSSLTSVIFLNTTSTPIIGLYSFYINKGYNIPFPNITATYYLSTIHTTIDGKFAHYIIAPDPPYTMGSAVTITTTVNGSSVTLNSNDTSNWTPAYLAAFLTSVLNVTANIGTYIVISPPPSTAFTTVVTNYTSLVTRVLGIYASNNSIIDLRRLSFLATDALLFPASNNVVIGITDGTIIRYIKNSGGNTYISSINPPEIVPANLVVVGNFIYIGLFYLQLVFNNGPGFVGGLACFLENTKILTNIGYRPVQDLKKGDLIKTLLHDYVPIDMIGKRDMYNPAVEERIKDQLYIFPAQDNVFEDLIITGCHSILVDDFKEGEREKTTDTLTQIFITDNKYRLPACVDERMKVYDQKGQFTVYHIALENNDYYTNYGIYANGLLVETCSKRYLKEISNLHIL